ncbi:MAG: hypothetical protein GY856_37705, partial [bacterium]|nr:hypothetical protein [bacterium]
MSPRMTALLLPAAALLAFLELSVRAPWGHEIDYTLAEGRTQRIREELEIVPAAGSAYLDHVGPSYSYADDGRLLSVTQPDGGRRSNCYPDGAGGEGSPGGGQMGDCPAGGGDADRLTRTNVVMVVTSATTQASQGSAEYSSITSSLSYHEDNQPAGVVDGLGRSIGLAVPQANADAQVTFQADGVSG